ncbi:NAD(P)-binding domain-containing protein [Enhydrobacter sp.]|jgi:thioredoxin reductase|uniref:NAD(P)-binding domain-containing protein n=1 Tax=Enhydrobacter sp. TaxID=1894999 RepID=UPI002607CB68|nr:NAD(P)-binding domain-containing protein [Enhydrobacter sp.]WIM09922.1 MAG: FAD-dependent pyridine nucleotide-disulfide oxidoreductase [Enhydrobacter sp.]
MSSQTDVAIVGAGPYGLSLASHLANRDVSFRIFGKPMESWLTQMPRDMQLKSEGFASSLYDPAGKLSLGSYCRERGLAYADLGLPVSLQTFCEYGLAFRRRAVPMLEETKVTALGRDRQGFVLQLDNGETVRARRVVMAVGISHFSHLPGALANLPEGCVSHSSAHTDFARFKGQDVVVLGAGSSAVDVAVLLHEAGARVRVVARRPEIEVHSRMRLPRPLSDRLRQPMTGIGPSWRSWFFTNLPSVFHLLPEARRLKWVRTHLGPAGGWFMADRFKRVQTLTAHKLTDAGRDGDKVRLGLMAGDGTRLAVAADHVIAATGYRPSLKRLAFIDRALAQAVAVVDDTPILSANFQSSVAGLYFVGPIAANSFGPLMRFAFGARFVARRLSRHLAATTSRLPDPAAAEPEPLGVAKGGLSPTVAAK